MIMEKIEEIFKDGFNVLQEIPNLDKVRIKAAMDKFSDINQQADKKMADLPYPIESEAKITETSAYMQYIAETP